METSHNDDRIMVGWEKSKTSKGIPYYINHKNEVTSWEHPYLSNVLEELNKYNDCHYAAYRSALKLRHIQTSLNLHLVELSSLEEIFEDYSFSENCGDTINCADIHNILCDLYHNVDKHHISEEDVSLYAELTQNLVNNIYDRKRTGCIKLRSFKVVLCVFCSAKLCQKYAFFFNEACDPSSYICKKDLRGLLEDLIKIPEFLKESRAFGRNVGSVITSCFLMVPNSFGISEDLFIKWLSQEPQIVVWLPTLHRVTASEKVQHDAKCSICKQQPIVGFRYKCLKCFNFDICQTCFFSQRSYKSHKVYHPMEEYCLETSSKENTKAFLKTLKNKFTRKRKCSIKPTYLPTPKNNEDEQIKRPRLASNDKAQTTACSAKISNTLLSCKQNSQNNAIPVLEELIQQHGQMGEALERLQEENRILQLELAELKERSDTESNLSFDDGLDGQQKNPLSGMENIQETKRFAINPMFLSPYYKTKTATMTESSSYSGSGSQSTSFPSNPNSTRTSPPSQQSSSTNSEVNSLFKTGLQNCNFNFTGKTSEELSKTPFKGSTGKHQLHSSLQSSKVQHAALLNPKLQILYHDNIPSPILSPSQTKDFPPDLKFQPIKKYDYPSPIQSHYNSVDKYLHSPRSPNSSTSFFNKTAWKSIDNIEDCSTTQYAFPSFTKSHCCPEDEELNNIVAKLNRMFTSNMSCSALSVSANKFSTSHDEMVKEAANVGSAMSQLMKYSSDSEEEQRNKGMRENKKFSKIFS